MSSEHAPSTMRPHRPIGAFAPTSARRWPTAGALAAVELMATTSEKGRGGNGPVKGPATRPRAREGQPVNTGGAGAGGSGAGSGVGAGGSK